MRQVIRDILNGLIGPALTDAAYRASHRNASAASADRPAPLALIKTPSSLLFGEWYSWTQRARRSELERFNARQRSQHAVYKALLMRDTLEHDTLLNAAWVARQLDSKRTAPTRLSDFIHYSLVHNASRQAEKDVFQLYLLWRHAIELKPFFDEEVYEKMMMNRRID